MTVLMMVTVGMELEVQHFREVARRKRVLALSFVLQAALLPALGFTLTHVLALPPI